MEIEVNVKQKKEVKYLKAECHVRYWEDAVVGGFEDVSGELVPCRKGEAWCPLIDLESGEILNWDKPVSAKIHYKVCDEGTYQLLDKDQNVIREIEGYVPKIMYPKENGYGDYVIMDVNYKGIIHNWKAVLDEFFN